MTIELQEIRDVTDEEVEFFEECGWVLLRRLTSPGLAATLLDAARGLLAPEVFKNTRVLEPVATEGIEPFRSFALSPQMGRAAQRLINRRRLTGVDLPVRFLTDHLWCKEPGAAPTSYHQDGVVQGGDRAGELAFWIALDEVTPDMGAVRFLSGSHREGPLGVGGAPQTEQTFAGEPAKVDPFQRHYAKLFELLELSPPLHLQPGDATVHKGMMVHGAGGNETGRYRWSYVPQYTPADTRYVDGTVAFNGRATIDKLALPLDPSKNPVVYP